MRKQLQAEHGKADLEKRIAELDAKKKKQSNKVIELRSKIEAINSRNQSRREVEQKKRQEEIKFLNYQATHLQRFLKQIEQQWALTYSKVVLVFVNYFTASIIRFKLFVRAKVTLETLSRHVAVTRALCMRRSISLLSERLL